MNRAADIEARAAEWLARRGEPGWSSAEQRALDDWLAEAMEHKAAFWRLDHGMRQFDRTVPAAEPAPPPPSRERGRWRHQVVAAAASILIVGLIGWSIWPGGGPAEPRTLVAETVVGGRGSMSFSDGSKVELNTASKARARFGERRREVWLDRGEAYFEVAHDASRPFVVHAGDARVTVLGTKFSVRRDGDRLRVAVTEGRVRLDGGAVDDSGRPTLIVAGDTAIMRDDAVLLASRSMQRVEDELAWRRGLLRFDQESLAGAAAEFNRYNHRRIEIADPDVAAIRIGGSFQARNADAFVRLLQDAYGLRVERREDRIIISD